MNKGIIFNIQKLSIHDGPGIRTVVFLKGCPLRCLWCANPESQKKAPEIACFTNRCIECGYCVEVCPKKAVHKDGKVTWIDRDLCDMCLKCVDGCCTNSLQLIGKEMTVDELLTEVLKDKEFYDKSGGGVTFSGGEPLSQSEFLLETLKECKAKGIHTAIETTGYADAEIVKRAAELLDLMFYDVKHIDPEVHKKLTGVSNELILKNLKMISTINKNIIARIPVVPTLNDDPENIRKTALFLEEIGIHRLELLPYHNFGEYKYQQIGREYSLKGMEAPSQEAMEALKKIVTDSVDPSKLVCEIVEA
ncbi:MAG: glycyl-radical enzyme activating protein [Clostridiales bacterium]|nr:glycyl-radical enzyme activating protein [Clostridiales bacterium]